MNIKRHIEGNINKNTNNITISLIQYIITLGTVALFSAYFFTRGYIHSFSLPITVGFSESGYFILILIADSLFPVIFSIITNIWILAVALLVFFINSKFKFFSKNNYFNRINSSWMRKITPLKFLIYFIVFVFLLQNILDLSFYIFPRSKYMELHFKTLESDVCLIFSDVKNENIFQTALCYLKGIFWTTVEFLLISFPKRVQNLFFFFSLILITLSVPIFINLFFKKIDFFRINFIKNLLVFILVILVATSASYILGRDYLTRLVHYPEYRINTETKEKRVQIWRGINYNFYVKCKKYGVSFIEGVNKNDKIFYVGWLDKHKHPSVCK